MWSTRAGFCISLIFIKKPSFECETFLHVLHGKQYDKQVQGSSVHIIELAPCVSSKNQKRCVKF